MDISLDKDQHILEEDYDENYEPTEEGKFKDRFVPVRLPWPLFINVVSCTSINTYMKTYRDTRILQSPQVGSLCRERSAIYC